MTLRNKAERIAYENFDLLIAATTDGYSVRVINAPSGETTTSFTLSFTAAELPRFVVRAGRHLRPVSSPEENATAQPLTPQVFGAHLYNAVFAGAVETQLLRSLDRARRDGAGLRIRLRFDEAVAALADLPWEYLYTPMLGGFVALSNQTVIVRYLALPQAQAPLRVEPPLHILALIATPHDAPPLQVELEWQRLERALQPLVNAGLVKLERLPSATLAALQARLRGDAIHIFHYIGHGYFDEAQNGGGLLLADEQQRSRRVEAGRLATLLHDHPSLCLVFLNACEGARSSRHDFFTGTAQTLVSQGIPAVVAMQFAVSDDAALTLGREFYASLVDNYPVDAALAEARKALYATGNNDEWATPVLFSRSPDNQILDLPLSPVSRLQSRIPFHVPFLYNDNFVGRDADLARLHELLAPERSPTFAKSRTSATDPPTPVGIRPAGLTGQGGIGKTQLAVAYAYACSDGVGSRAGYRGSYPGGIFWLNAAEPWLQEFARLGVDLDSTCVDQNQTQQIRIVRDYLRDHPDSLLILDNVADPAALNRPVTSDLIPAALPCRVLFTTRRRDLARFQPVELNVLPEEAALRLLLSHEQRRPLIDDPDQPDYAAAQRVCAILGYLPLALEIAAAHLGKHSSRPIAAYEQMLLQRGALAVVDDARGGVRDADLGTRHAAAVAATLQEQWDDLESGAVDETTVANARLLLRVAGQLGEAAQIPMARLGLLAGVSAVDDGFFGAPLEGALTLLIDASLIAELHAEELRLHPLVREFAAQQTPATEVAAFRAQCIANLHRAYCDIATLEDQVDRRGVLAVEQDLTTALALSDAPTGSDTKGGEPSNNSQIQNLLTLLQRQSHNVRAWRRRDFPAGLAQQLLFQAQGMGLDGWIGRLCDRLQQGVGRHLTTEWRTGRESVSLARTLQGHSTKVNGVTVTPDGQRIVSASYDGMLKVWNLTTGEEERTLQGHSASANGVAVTSDGQHIVSASSDKTLKVWNLATGEVECTLQGHSGVVNGVAVTPDGQRIVSASSDKTLKVWNLAAGTEERTLRGHIDRVTGVAVTPDGQRVVSASDDRTVKAWNLSTGKEERAFHGHTASVTGVAVMQDSQHIVSASDDQTLKVWNLGTSKEERTFHGHTSFVTGVAVTSDGQRVVSASYDQTVKVWNLATGKEEHILHGHKASVIGVAVTPDGQRVVSASYDKTVKVWNLAMGEEERTLYSHMSLVTSVVVTPDGQRVVSTSSDQTVKVWNLATGEEERTFHGHTSLVTGVAVTPDGQRVVSASYDQTLKVWNLATGEEERTFHGHTAWVTGVVVTPDGQRVVSVSSDWTMKIWNLATGKEERTSHGHTHRVNGIVVTPDGQRVVSVSSDWTMKVWNLATGKEERIIHGHTDRLTGVAVTQDGQRIVSASDDHTLKVWKLATGEEERTFHGHTAWVKGVAVTPDGQRIVSASDDHTLKVWKLATGEMEITITLAGGVECVAVAPDGVTIVAGDAGGNVYCFRLVVHNNGAQ